MRTLPVCACASHRAIDNKTKGRRPVSRRRPFVEVRYRPVYQSTPSSSLRRVTIGGVTLAVPPMT